MTLDRAGRVYFSLRGKVGRMGFFSGLESAKVNGAFGDLDACFPSGPHLLNAKQPVPVVTPCLANVLRVSDSVCVTQVDHPVVVFDAVDVVDLTDGPCAGRVKPRQTMGFVLHAIHRDDNIALGVNASGVAACRDSVGRANPADECSGFRVVVQERPETVSSQLITAASLGHVGHSKIAAVAIQENDLGSRPAPVMMQPSKLRDLARLAVNADDGGSRVNYLTDTPRIGAFAALDFAGEAARFWVKVKNFAQTLCAKIGLSHAVVPLQRWFGQKPDSVRSGFGLRYFSIEGTSL